MLCFCLKQQSYLIKKMLMSYYCHDITEHATCFSAIPVEPGCNVCMCAVSYTHLDVYKRQLYSRVRPYESH